MTSRCTFGRHRYLKPRDRIVPPRSRYRYSKEKKNKDSALEYSRVYRSGRRRGPAEEREKEQPERAEGDQGSDALRGRRGNCAKQEGVISCISCCWYLW